MEQRTTGGKGQPPLTMPYLGADAIPISIRDDPVRAELNRCKGLFGSSFHTTSRRDFTPATTRATRMDSRGNPMKARSASRSASAQTTMGRFAALDFETADSGFDSACAVSVVLVDGLTIVKSVYALIQPP